MDGGSTMGSLPRKRLYNYISKWRTASFDRHAGEGRHPCLLSHRALVQNQVPLTTTNASRRSLPSLPGSCPPGRHARTETQIRADARKTRRWDRDRRSTGHTAEQIVGCAICVFCVNRLPSALHAFLSPRCRKPRRLRCDPCIQTDAPSTGNRNRIGKSRRLTRLPKATY